MCRVEANLLNFVDTISEDKRIYRCLLFWHAGPRIHLAQTHQIYPSCDLSASQVTFLVTLFTLLQAPANVTGGASVTSVTDECPYARKTLVLLRLVCFLLSYVQGTE